MTRKEVEFPEVQLSGEGEGVGASKPSSEGQAKSEVDLEPS